ncbi:MAG TPA: gliding motility-associated C-terminal domain-containing protein, partial [Saprospiraceae bacterium]|nr:gliding motility-associated C-terminal domain-containing protein [Saprospiraceae bacterium]
VAIQSSTCDPAAAGVFTYNLINKYGCDSTVTETVLLLPSDTTYLAFSTCDPAQTGTVKTVLPNQWGCDSTVVAVTSLLPPASCGVTATLTGSNIPCGSTTGSLTLTATLGEAPFSYTILLGATSVATGTVNAVGVPQTVNGLAAGNYTLNISSVNGFSATAQATIVQLVPPVVTATVVSNYNGYAVSCTGDTDGSANVIATGGAAPYKFAWSNGGTTQQINNIGVGNYSVTVTDANNCTSIAGVELNEPGPLNFTFTVNDLDCFGQHDGAIFVEPTGGVSPYRYSLDNIHFQNTNVFYNLNSGVYTVTTLDANDCQRMETILINAAIPLVVELGDNQTIEQGGSTIIQAIVNVPQDSILSVAWTPPFDSSECPECLTQTVAPLVSTTYSVHVTALNGCDDEDKIVVIVDRRRHIFIPNVFSPNGDGDNDIVGVFAKPGTVRSIKSFRIFDRWGEAVYTLENFAPNDPTLGWDGRLNGQPMNPGVFVWYVEVEFIDGVVELYEGDVTIVR